MDTVRFLTEVKGHDVTMNYKVKHHMRNKTLSNPLFAEKNMSMHGVDADRL